MRGAVGAAVLVALGGAVLTLTLSGEYLDYVRATHRPWLLVTAAGLVVLGLACLFVRDDPHPEPSHPGPSRPRRHTHGPLAASPAELAAARRTDRSHDHRRVPAVGWLLCLPLLLVLVVTPPPLGALAAGRADPAVPPPPSGTRYDALPAGDPVPLAVHDYAVRAAWDAGRTLAGRTVTLTGFVTPDDAGGWSVSRAVMTCCALDARSYLVHVDGDPTRRAAGTWVEVVGNVVPAPGGSARTAAVRAASVRPVPRPANPYEE
ncbi:TIGR03943 family putative permease subunit [Actinomycetospora rhizophila]|uniref:TIGR03943 family putative permease subunit n=1 Tax=Actinomycetospora rhizophila TaxID=1416876 RepID=A0ABV9Z884_9PSEU